jgi:hypothetical protein
MCKTDGVALHIALALQVDLLLALATSQRVMCKPRALQAPSPTIRDFPLK